MIVMGRAKKIKSNLILNVLTILFSVSLVCSVIGLCFIYYKVGSIFVDNNNADFLDKNTIIYGNNMKEGSMFGKLNS